jgi:hypothetical protein
MVERSSRSDSLQPSKPPDLIAVPFRWVSTFRSLETVRGTSPQLKLQHRNSATKGDDYYLAIRSFVGDGTDISLERRSMEWYLEPPRARAAQKATPSTPHAQLHAGLSAHEAEHREWAEDKAKKLQLQQAHAHGSGGLTWVDRQWSGHAMPAERDGGQQAYGDPRLAESSRRQRR